MLMSGGLLRGSRRRQEAHARKTRTHTRLGLAGLQQPAPRLNWPRPLPLTRKPSTGDPPGILQMRGTVMTEARSSQMVSSSPSSPGWMWGKGTRLQGRVGQTYT